MKRGVSILIITAGILILSVFAGCSTTAASDTHVYKERVSQFEQDDSTLYDVVFIGDSLTSAGEWDEYFEDVKVANRGIWGDTAKGVLRRMDSILSTQAETAFILLGVNDLSLGASPREVADRYERIVTSLVDEDMDVYIQSTLPVFSSGRIQQLIEELNEYLQEIAQEFGRVEYIDVASSMSRDEYGFDGVHLNDRGYEVWKEVIREYIE